MNKKVIFSILSLIFILVLVASKNDLYANFFNKKLSLNDIILDIKNNQFGQIKNINNFNIDKFDFLEDLEYSKVNNLVFISFDAGKKNNDLLKRKFIVLDSNDFVLNSYDKVPRIKILNTESIKDNQEFVMIKFQNISDIPVFTKDEWRNNKNQEKAILISFNDSKIINKNEFGTFITRKSDVYKLFNMKHKFLLQK